MQAESLCLALCIHPGHSCNGYPQQEKHPLPIKAGVFMTGTMIKQAGRNAELNPQAAEMRNEIIEAAKPWLDFSDNQLWEMMFGNTIKRSWMVWSDGYCPSCKKGVPMYSWVMDPIKNPWKVKCPHCLELFPKNDFETFYHSGMDEHFVFDPAKADRSLLFNTEHPDPDDPLHKFCVDDGEGWLADGHRWRFIGAYLIYGQWKGLIVNGILKLSEAYAVTGDTAFSHRAGILLDRVADLYPTHDFGKQGLVYENPGMTGYVSTWHDACQETRQLAIAYDIVRMALAEDYRLVSFLTEKSEEYIIPLAKKTPADILANIENGILTDPQVNRRRIYSNYPQTDMTLSILKKIRNNPGDSDSAMIILDEVIKKATAVDGQTGEKGLTGYTAYGSARVAEVLSLYSRADSDFLKTMIKKHPRIIDMFRFHIDVWCGQMHYPNIGDCDGFALPDTTYKGLSLSKKPGIKPSMYSFLWQLYMIAKDPAFVQILYHGNGGKTEGLPYDIFSPSPEKFRRQVAMVIEKHGEVPEIRSVNKKEWHLAVLKSGTGDRERALWIDYDAGGYHSHADGLNIGLFAFGLDLLPDFGYPPVQFGGWASEKARWYSGTSAHNTVVVDGRDQINKAGTYEERTGFEGQPAGKTTLWSDGRMIKAIRAEVPEAYEIERYERTVAMVDVSADDFYVLDLFRVKGGKDHARMTYSSFGTISAGELNLVPSDTSGLNAMLRNLRTDKSPHPGWSADWKIEDRYNTSKTENDVHLRLTDLTEGATASVAEAWIISGFTSTEGEWIPSVVTRRQGTDTLLASGFVSILQPYISTPFIASVNRLPASEETVAVEIVLSDNRHDLWIAGGRTDMVVEITSGADKIEFRGDMLLLRRNKDGSISDISMVNASLLRAGEWYVELAHDNQTIELQIFDNKVYLQYGPREYIKEIRHRGKPVKARMPVKKD